MKVNAPPDRPAQTLAMPLKGVGTIPGQFPPDSPTPWTPAALAAMLASAGDRTVVRAVTGGVSRDVSGNGLLALVRGVAAALGEAGVGPGDTAAIWAPNSPEWVAVGIACHLTGVIFAPVDAMLSAEEALDQVRDSKARAVFVQGERAQAFGPDDGAIVLEQLRPSDKPLPERDYPQDTPIALFRTSGTTGKPKLFHLSLRNIGWNVDFICRSGDFAASDRVLLPLPMHHVFPWITATLSCLTLGATLILPESPTGPHIAQAMVLTRPTILIGVPRLYEALLAAVRERLRSAAAFAVPLYEAILALVKRLLPLPGGHVATLLLAPVRRSVARDLRLAISGGAHLDVEVEREMEALGWDVRGGYGLAETSASVTAPIGGKRAGSTGRAVPGCEIRIDAPADNGTGEILVKGPVVFSGYLDNPEANARAFTEDGFFRTGDLGHLDDDGFLFVTGRAKEVIVLANGDNVFPEDVERHYLADPVIAEIGILEKDGALVAVVVPDLAEVARRKLIDPREIVSIALATIGKTLPSSWRLSGFALSHEPLPRTRLMKLRRFMLPAIYEDARAGNAGTQKREMSAEDKAWIAAEPQAQLWALLEAQFPGKPLTLDSYVGYDLGLDSFGWMNLALVIEQETGIGLSLDDIAGVATVRDLLSLLVERQKAPSLPNRTLETRIAAAAEHWLSPRTFTERVVGRLLYALDAAVMRVLFRLKVEGQDIFDGLAGSPVLICPNHISELDPLAVAAAMPAAFRRRSRWSGSRGAAFGTRLRRAVARSIGMFPVDREMPMVAVGLGRQALRQGHVQVWFPEGMLSPDGQLMRFHEGVGRLIEGLDVAVVPAFIEGTYEAMPRERGFPRLAKIRVSFGAAAEAAELEKGASGPQEVADRLRERVLALAEATGRTRPRPGQTP